MTLLIVLKSMILTFFLTVILGQLGSSLPCCPQSRVFCTLLAVLVQRGQFGWFLPQWCSASHWMRSGGSWSLASLPNTLPQAAARSTGVKLCCWNSSGWTEYETDLERKKVIPNNSFTTTREVPTNLLLRSFLNSSTASERKRISDTWFRKNKCPMPTVRLHRGVPGKSAEHFNQSEVTPAT